jgi:hypothetical protein
MSLSRWVLAVSLMVGLGCLQVAQRNALVLKGYALGERQAQMHEDQVVLHWLQADVTRLGSPSSLASAAQTRKWKFVARAVVPAAPALSAVAKAPAGPLITVAALDAAARVSDDAARE